MKKNVLTATLESRKQQLNNELSEIIIEVTKEMVKHHYPIIKSKFEGKYFKTSNCYNQEETWSLYTKVTNIKPEDVYDTHGNGVTSHFSGWAFQTDSRGRVTIENVKHSYVHSIGKEISEKEFNAAWNKMVDNINALE